MEFSIQGKDLFSDRIEAWKYGPVIPNLCRMTKSYGRNPIPHECISDLIETNIDLNTQTFLENVFEQYGNLTNCLIKSNT